MITHFDLDPDKLAIIQDCMDNYDVGSPEAEWANNIISRKAVVYQSGVIARRDAVLATNPIRTCLYDLESFKPRAGNHSASRSALETQ